MGETGTKETWSNLSLSKCNGCERDVRLSSKDKLKDSQVAELQARMLCSDCLKKTLDAKK